MQRVGGGDGRVQVDWSLETHLSLSASPLHHFWTKHAQPLASMMLRHDLQPKTFGIARPANCLVQTLLHNCCTTLHQVRAFGTANIFAICNWNERGHTPNCPYTCGLPYFLSRLRLGNFITTWKKLQSPTQRHQSPSMDNAASIKIRQKN